MLIYAQIMPAPVRCDVQPIDVQNASAPVLQAHFDGLVECLVRAWQPPVTNAGFIIIRPTVTIYGESITTKCGDSGINAFWCSADQQIYYSSELPNQLSALRGKWAADVVMAHEFGHLLQGRTGLFASGIIASQSTGSEEEGLIFRRRLETQADCFSGTFIRSVSTSLNIQQADVEVILNSYVVVGDDAASGDPNVVGDHGLSRSRLYWGNVGLGTSDIGACNTFVAADNLVRLAESRHRYSYMTYAGRGLRASTSRGVINRPVFPRRSSVKNSLKPGCTCFGVVRLTTR